MVLRIPKVLIKRLYLFLFLIQSPPPEKKKFYEFPLIDRRGSKSPPIHAPFKHQPHDVSPSTLFPYAKVMGSAASVSMEPHDKGTLTKAIPTISLCL